jgi:hypothetical protein
MSTREEKLAYHRRYYEEHRTEQLAAQRAKLQAMTPEQREQRRADKRAYYRVNAEVERARVKAYKVAHKEEVQAKLKAYQLNNKYKIAARRKRYWLENRERLIAQQAERYARQRSTRWAADLKSKYNVSRIRFDAMLVAQLGCCSLCERPMTGPFEPVVEHDHRCCPGKRSCGKCVRGLAHSACNTAFGLLKEDPDIIYTVAEAARIMHSKRQLEIAQ